MQAGDRATVIKGGRFSMMVLAAKLRAAEKDAEQLRDAVKHKDAVIEWLIDQCEYLAALSFHPETFDKAYFLNEAEKAVNNDRKI